MWTLMKILASYWIDGSAAATLGLSTLFSYAHASFGTAVICGICAGVCFGLACGRWSLQRRRVDEEGEL